MMRLLVACVLLAAVAAPARAAETLQFGRFGTVTVYRNSPRPGTVIVFASGDGAWNQGVIDMAEGFAKMDALVVGFETPRFLGALQRVNEACSYPAADLQALGQLVEKRFGYPRYVPPVLVGYSSGATLVYAALVQAPPNTFQGAISIGFCPDLPVQRPFCRGHGLAWTPGPKGKGYNFLPASTLEQPWIALQGEDDKTCRLEPTKQFAAKVAHGSVMALPDVGHRFSLKHDWMPQFGKALDVLRPREAKADTGRVAPPAGPAPSAAPTPPAPEVKDLPVVELKATSAENDTLAVILSGDGGWAGIDKSVGGALQARGISVVGLDSLKYFWTKRTPEETSRDVARILSHYSAAWHKSRFVLIGYSFGADVLPSVARRLPPELLEKVALLAYLGMSESATFEFHVADWLGGGGGDELPVAPEVERLRGRRMLCLYGSDERDSICRKLDDGLAKKVELKGGHHFGGAYEQIAALIAAQVE